MFIERGADESDLVLEFGSFAPDGSSITLEVVDYPISKAEASGKRIFLYFETDWCGPCHTMDEWIWTDAEVVEALRAGYVGVKLDGDIEKAHLERYDVKGYPNLQIVAPASGAADQVRAGIPVVAANPGILERRGMTMTLRTLHRLTWR